MAVEHHPLHDDGTYLDGVSADLIADTIQDMLGPDVTVVMETFDDSQAEALKPSAIITIYGAKATSKGDPGDPRTGG